MIVSLVPEAIIYNGPGPSDLKLTAKRYTTVTSEIEGLTLLFAHCIGSCKEQWENVIHSLFLLQASKKKEIRIREAISFDWQNHGDAALLNEDALKSRPKGVSVYEWSRAIAYFIKTHLSGHRLVPMGHSAGASAMMLTTKEFPIENIPYIALLVIEPTMITRELYSETKEDRETTMKFVMKGTYSRRGDWPNKDDAFDYLRQRLPWSFWDRTALRLYTEHGLRTVSSSPNHLNVVLKCDRNQEAISYPDTEPHFEATTQLARVCKSLPVHLIFGDRNDIVPEYIQDSLADTAAGRIAASVTRIGNAGHMVVQEQPEDLAKAIAIILDTVMPAPLSRL